MPDQVVAAASQPSIVEWTRQSAAAPAAPPARAPAPSPAAPSAPAKVTPGSAEWNALTPAQRHDQLRGPANPRAQGYSPAREQREAMAERAAGEPAPAAPQEPSGDAPASTEVVKIGKYETSEAELAAMLDRQARDDLRKANVPATPDDYKLELAPGAKLPGDTDYKFDADNPGLAALKSWAHAKGFDQSTLSEILTIYATNEAQQHAALAAISRAEIAKAGHNAPQRVDAVAKWIRGEVGDADAVPILATMVTDSHLRFFEKMQQRVTSQGAASFSQSHRVAPDNNSIPGFDKMSFEQQRFAQDQLRARR